MVPPQHIPAVLAFLGIQGSLPDPGTARDQLVWDYPVMTDQSRGRAA